MYSKERTQPGILETFSVNVQTIGNQMELLEKTKILRVVLIEGTHQELGLAAEAAQQLAKLVEYHVKKPHYSQAMKQSVMIS